MEIEAEEFDVSQECYNILESILEQARKKINPKSRPKKILKCIGKVLRKSGFKYKDQEELLSQSLLIKGIDCRHYSLLYYSIGEELSLPLNMVVVPVHVFVRWNDGKYSLNWETTLPEEINEKKYIVSYKIHEKSIANGVYLKNLTREEAKSFAFDARANVKYKKGDLEAAIMDQDKVIELYSGDAGSYNNRGLIKAKIDHLEDALEDYNKAIELDPNYAYAYSNRGLIEYGYGKFDEAFEDFEKAIELDPDFPEPYHNRGLIKEDRGDKKGAKTDFKLYKKLKKKEKKEKNY